VTHQQELFQACLTELLAGRDVVRAVILRTWGSTPREVGADMVIDSQGQLLGTVGGGCGEAEVYELARELLEDSTSPQGAILHVDLTENPDDGGGKVCGGRFDVLLHRLTAQAHLSLVTRVVESLRSGKTVVWRTDLGSSPTGFWKQGASRKELCPEVSLDSVSEDPDVLLISEQGQTVFAEPVGLSRRLVIVGAGHIARPLCAMAALAGYQVHILDDRAEYARAEFFPDADEVHCGDYEKALPPLVQGRLVSVVLVTRGHRHDQECLRLVADCDLEYLGMIGSKRRVKAVFQDLLVEGVPKQRLDRVCAPIGLDIGAQTPAEIAICILAEMIARRRLPAEGWPSLSRRPH